MTQKFELDPERPADEQIRKTEFNYKIEGGRVSIYYHFKEGEITSKFETYVRDDLIGNVKIGDMNEKDEDEDKQSQINKKIIKMEQSCNE